MTKKKNPTRTSTRTSTKSSARRRVTQRRVAASKSPPPTSTRAALNKISFPSPPQEVLLSNTICAGENHGMIIYVDDCPKRDELDVLNRYVRICKLESNLFRFVAYKRTDFGYKECEDENLKDKVCFTLDDAINTAKYALKEWYRSVGGKHNLISIGGGDV